MGKLSDALEKSTPKSSNDNDWQRSKKVPKVQTGSGKAPQTNTQEHNNLITSKWDKRLLLANALNSSIPEEFRRIRNNIIHTQKGKPLKTILVTSIASSEGKGFVSANLGISIAKSMEHNALIVDCDLRKPGIAKMFGLPNETGLAEYLESDLNLSSLIKNTTQPKLSIIPAGKPPANPADLIDSHKMNQFVAELCNQDDGTIIIFDSPPHFAASEIDILTKHVEGIILVVRPGFSTKEHVKEFVDIVGKDKVIGCVFNAYETTTSEKIFQSRKGYGGYDLYGTYGKY